jgi:hypothetical protein
MHSARTLTRQPASSRLVPGVVRHHRCRCAPRRCLLVFGRFPPRAPIKGTVELHLSSHRPHQPLIPPPSSIKSAPPPSPSTPVSTPSFLQWPRVKLMWFTSFTTSPRTRHTILLHLSRLVASPATSPPWEPAPSPLTGRPEPPPAKIDPTTVTPYPCPCYASTPTTQNQITGEEPPSRSPAAGSSPPRADRRFPPDAIPLPPHWRVGPHPQHRHRAVTYWRASLGRPRALG